MNARFLKNHKNNKSNQPNKFMKVNLIQDIIRYSAYLHYKIIKNTPRIINKSKNFERKNNNGFERENRQNKLNRLNDKG